jgi:hypothetical protein
MTNSYSTQNPNAWIITYKVTSESSPNTDDNYTKFGKQQIYYKDSQQNKKEVTFYKLHEAGKFMEANLMQIKIYIEVCDAANWHGEDRFRNFKQLLGGQLLLDWEQLMANGSETWHRSNNYTDEHFRKALKAFFIRITKAGRPCNTQQQSIMECKYSSTRDEDGRIPMPSDYWTRMSHIWRLSELYIRDGMEIHYEFLLEAEHFGLPQEAKEWLEDEAEN